MSETQDALVLDSGPLSGLAEAGWLGVLRSVSGERTVVIPDAVGHELRNGRSRHPHLTSVLEAEWISEVELVTGEELQAFGHFASLLVAGTHNVGEAAVLAYAQVHGATAIVDDGAGRRAARDAGVRHQGTLGLLCEAIRQGKLTAELVSDVADHLIETKYRLPFPPGGFVAWAKDRDLFGEAGTASPS